MKSCFLYFRSFFRSPRRKDKERKRGAEEEEAMESARAEDDDDDTQLDHVFPFFPPPLSLHPSQSLFHLLFFVVVWLIVAAFF
jgi:hypothetical protein